MKCSNCNTENTDTAKFCKKCGSPLTENKNYSHEKMINSMSGNAQSNNNTTKIIIIALAVIAVVLAGAFVYLYAFGDSGASDSASGSSSAQVDSNSHESTSSSPAQVTQTSSSSSSSSPSTSSMRILGGSFSTGSAEEDLTYASIYVGKEYAGKDVIVQIYYSRDGNSLNHGNMVPASVHSDGYLEIASADAYHYYPDYATINLYDSNSNLIDTQSVSLSPTSGTQSF